MLLIAALLPILCDQSPSFDREVLPILSDFCFPCHGPDAQARKASLRFDLPETTLRKNDPLVVPGKPEESELFIRMGKISEGKSVPAYLSTHPDSEDRLETIEEEIKDKQNNYVHSDKLDNLFQQLTIFNNYNY